jgi:hypothetical protein
VIRLYVKDTTHHTAFLLANHYTFDAVWDTMEKLPPGTKYLRFQKWDNSNVIIPIDEILSIIESES